MADERLTTGAQPSDAADVDVLASLGVTWVLNLCEDAEYPVGARGVVVAAYAEHGIREQRLSTVDYGGLRRDLLEDGAAAVVDALADGKDVYVHCRAGWQRSATLAAAAICLRDGVPPDVALARVQRARPAAMPLGHQLEDLWRWWNERRAA